jgi:hypothetical protein
MNFDTISKVWGNLNNNSKIVIITEKQRYKIAESIKNDNKAYVTEIFIFDIDIDEYEQQIKALSENDLVIALFTINGFMNKNYRNVFSPFSKPLDIKSKYIFIRLDIPEKALLTGLNTDFSKVCDIIHQLQPLSAGKKVKVTTAKGTNIDTCIKSQEILPYQAQAPGGNAFLPPSEVTEELLEGSTNGTIVVDVTVGELRFNGDLIDELGIIDELVTIKIENGLVTDIVGGEIAKRLKKGLDMLDNNLHMVVEFGHGLSDIEPTGIIGVDESMNGTCHFGIGNRNPYHLDLVLSNPEITVI